MQKNLVRKEGSNQSMSAGIIVMNKNAIAMAVDSAVTVGDHQAIHNSANKLFALSRFDPVGAIIYANALFMQVPMDIIIKQYKIELGNKGFSTLQEYVEDFITFLENNCELFRFKVNEESYVVEICIDLLKGLANGYTGRAKKLMEKLNRPLTELEDSEVKKQAIEETLQFIDAQTKVRDELTAYVETHYLDTIDRIIAKNIPWVPDVSELRKRICKLFDTHFTRFGFVGMAIAGYGNSEIFPHMVHIKISGIINGKLRYEVLERVDIHENNPAAIVPLAQTDVMETFIRGCNDVILGQVASNAPNLVRKRIEAIPENRLAAKYKEEVSKAFDGFQNEIANLIQQISNEVFTRPIINSVTTLPIEELALFAESMINITSVRRRVAIDGNIGTVGGPIDVSIVSRGDGLIWLKRKHYFESKMNPQFFYTRYRQTIREVIADENE